MVCSGLFSVRLLRFTHAFKSLQLKHARRFQALEIGRQLEGRLPGKIMVAPISAVGLPFDEIEGRFAHAVGEGAERSGGIGLQ